MALEEKAAYSKGLEGVVAGETKLSLVDGANGRLYYRGISVDELIKGNSSFEETIYFLWYGKLPTRKELEDFSKEEADQREIDPQIHTLLANTSKNIHPMAALRTAVSALAHFDPEADDNSREANLRKAKRLLARIPTIIASFAHARQGQKPVAPRKDLSHAAHFLYLLTGKEPKPEFAKALDQYLILLADHGYNASTFAARVTVSTLSDIYSGTVSAIGTLKGDLHGSANQRAMEMILEVGDTAKAEKWILDALASKKKIMGFGHRIYKKEDPRAVIFKEITRKTVAGTKFEQYFKTSEIIEGVVRREKQLPCNVDFYSATLLYAVGIPTDLFTTIFALSRTAGWSAHILEQLEDNRLIRPDVIYSGKSGVSYTPIEKRA